MVAHVPALLFCLTFGLSMDYEVFLISRIREYWLDSDQRAADNDEAVALGIARTGRVVTAAALLMAVSFATLMAAQVSVMVMFGLGVTLARLHIPRTADAYLCGPTAFMQEVAASLSLLGLEPGRIRSEIFGTAPAMTPGIVGGTARPPHQPAGPPGTGPTISFARSGLSVKWASTYASLLELAEACSVPTRWSCRTGVCHNCETGLLSGTVTYSPDPVDAPADGNVLICCSQPGGDLVLDL